ncbi:MAG: hypothetical protein R3B91_17575 [Planctomycetaceae bacterium]
MPANRTQMKTGGRFGVDLMPGRVIAIGDESLAASVETVRREYASRRTRHAARARRFREGATLISRCKRFVTYSIIGYVVFDPTVGAVLVPLFLGLLPVTLLQSWCVRRWLRAMSRATFYASGIRRLDDRWQGRGETGQRYLDLSHEYAADLDLFGRGSLYELLCTARTQAGQDVLAQWLLNPADRPTIIERQQAIKELRDQVDLREAVATVNVISQRRGIKGMEIAFDWWEVFSTGRGRMLATLWIAVVVIRAIGTATAGGQWWAMLAVGLMGEAVLYHTVRLRLQSLARSIHELKLSMAASKPLRKVISRSDVTTPLLLRLRDDIDGASWFRQTIHRMLYALAQRTGRPALVRATVPLWNECTAALLKNSGPSRSSGSVRSVVFTGDLCL